jgi:Cu(I)/Ag(I) efflux system membrane protein CusA/SilA
VALLSITFVPAMIPIFIRGRLRSEEDNWIVRSFIEIYKPVLTWLMKVPAAGLWFVGFLFVIGAGLIGGRVLFLGVLVLALFFGCVFFARLWSQGLALVLLLAAALWAWHLPKIGREFMPPLDEGSIMDMPITVPRVSIVQAGDDIRIRDKIMARFPEVDQVVGKAGRADTPTDPSGIDMVETIVSLKPKAWWPKRKIRFADALGESRRLMAELQGKGFLKADMTEEQAQSLSNQATMEAMTQFDRAMRELAYRRQKEFEPVLARRLTAAALNDLLGLLRTKGSLKSEPTGAGSAAGGDDEAGQRDGGSAGGARVCGAVAGAADVARLAVAGGQGRPDDGRGW